MYVREFGAVRWSKGADLNFSDLIPIFEEYRWDWSYQAFREWDGWNAEHGDIPANPVPAIQDTARLAVSKKAFTLNSAEK
jgi:endoglucanase